MNHCKKMCLVCGTILLGMAYLFSVNSVFCEECLLAAMILSILGVCLFIIGALIKLYFDTHDFHNKKRWQEKKV